MSDHDEAVDNEVIHRTHNSSTYAGVIGLTYCSDMEVEQAYSGTSRFVGNVVYPQLMSQVRDATYSKP